MIWRKTGRADVVYQGLPRAAAQTRPDFVATAGEACRQLASQNAKLALFIGMPSDSVLEATQDLGPLLIVDDDKAFLQRLARAMEKRGFTVDTAESVREARSKVEANPPAYAVVDMRLEDGNGLDVVELLRTRRPDSRAVVLTGYGNIATAVTAVKIGAIDYLAKPADADDVFDALTREPGQKPPPPENPMSADRVRWEHIQRVYELCDRNVSETARRLNMHRRTLQRILAKRAPR